MKPFHSCLVQKQLQRIGEFFIAGLIKGRMVSFGSTSQQGCNRHYQNYYISSRESFWICGCHMAFPESLGFGSCIKLLPYIVSLLLSPWAGWYSGRGGFNVCHIFFGTNGFTFFSFWLVGDLGEQHHPRCGQYWTKKNFRCGHVFMATQPTPPLTYPGKPMVNKPLRKLGRKLNDLPENWQNIWQMERDHLESQPSFNSDWSTYLPRNEGLRACLGRYAWRGICLVGLVDQSWLELPAKWAPTWRIIPWLVSG